MMLGDVTTCHPSWLKKKESWCVIRAIIDNDARKYLPVVDASDPERCRQYKEAAILTNFTKLTKDGLRGLVFQKDPKIQLPTKLEYLDEDATGEGLALDSLAMKILDEVLTTGNAFCLVDYPAQIETLSAAQKEKGEYLARIKLYAVEKVINFKCRYIGSKYVPYLIVLQECLVDDETDMFAWQEKIQYRVLMLDESGFYCQMLLDDYGQLKENPMYPRDATGNYLDFIPFKFIGADNNDYKYDDSPLHSLALLNLGHYRNSADQEESGFICGQPFLQICVGDTSIGEFNEGNPNGVKYGSRGALLTASGGSASLLQANPNTMIGTMMQDKLRDAAAIGARLIAPAGGRETAEAARIRYGSQNSSLHIIVHNIDEALECLCAWVALFEGADETQIEIDLNKEFYDDTIDPNLLMAQIQLLDRGVLAATDIRDYLKKGGALSLDRTDEMIDSEAEVVDPLA